jgi:hypothetical protein
VVAGMRACDGRCCARGGLFVLEAHPVLVVCAGSLAHPVLYGDTITDEVVWDVWVRGPGHPTLHHRCVFPNTGNALPELVRTGLLINSTVDTLGNSAGAIPATAATTLATLPPVLLALFAANAMGSRVPVWSSKVCFAGWLWFLPVCGVVCSVVPGGHGLVPCHTRGVFFVVVALCRPDAACGPTPLEGELCCNAAPCPLPRVPLPHVPCPRASSD